MSTYTDQLAIQGYLQRDLTESEVTYIKTAIEAASDYIDRFTGTNWASGQEGESRLYSGGDEYLFIDPAVDISLVELLDNDGSVNTTLATADWTAYPLNGQTITYLRFNGYRRWPRGNANVRITGKFGEVDGVPADIRHAATVLACGFIRLDKNLRMEDIEGYRRQFADIATQDPEVIKILEARRKVFI